MRRLSYPDSPPQGEHVAFINDFYDLRDEYDNNGATPDLADKMGRYMGDWLVNHIGKVDKALGAFLRSRGEVEPYPRSRMAATRAASPKPSATFGRTTLDRSRIVPSILPDRIPPPATSQTPGMGEHDFVLGQTAR